jgi:adenylyltransferase/sulfurtransferase
VPGIVGSIQATEAIKLALGLSETLSGRLLLIDVMRMRFRTIQIQRDPSCPACGTHEITELIDYDAFCGVGSSSAAAREIDDDVREITPRDLASRLARGDDIMLLDVREPAEWAVARIDGARLIPLATLQRAASSLDRSREIVVHCHHGIRSLAAVRYLRAEGFERIWNLAGGIARWSSEVDAAVPQY